MFEEGEWFVMRNCHSFLISFSLSSFCTFFFALKFYSASSPAPFYCITSSPLRTNIALHKKREVAGCIFSFAVSSSVQSQLWPHRGVRKTDRRATHVCRPVRVLYPDARNLPPTLCTYTCIWVTGFRHYSAFTRFNIRCCSLNRNIV